jgi:hypothetical protein
MATLPQELTIGIVLDDMPSPLSTTQSKQIDICIPIDLQIRYRPTEGCPAIGMSAPQS